MSDEMFYVAEPKDQPGTCYAACVDDDKFRIETAFVLGGWIKDGAAVRRVDGDTMRAMMARWVRP